MSLPVLLFPSYEDAMEFSNRVGLYIHVHDDPTHSVSPWGPVYAETYDNQGVPLQTPPTVFGVQWDSFMDTAVWTIATSDPLPVHTVGETLLTPAELAAEKPWILRYAVVRGTYNGGTWVEYTPPVEEPPPEE